MSDKIKRIREIESEMIQLNEKIALNQFSVGVSYHDADIYEAVNAMKNTLEHLREEHIFLQNGLKSIWFELHIWHDHFINEYFNQPYTDIYTQTIDSITDIQSCFVMAEEYCKCFNFIRYIVKEKQYSLVSITVNNESMEDGLCESILTNMDIIINHPSLLQMLNSGEIENLLLVESLINSKSYE